MGKAGRIAAATAALLLLGAGTQAHAQSVSGLRVKPGERADTRSSLANENRWGPTDATKTIKLDSRRWGIKLNLEQPVGRDPTPKDMEAGAYYRITPSLRIGGAVRFDEKAEGRRNLTPNDQQPRVRLETAFQF